MVTLSRRRFLGATAAGGAAAGLGVATRPAPASADPAGFPPPDSVAVDRDDPRYRYLAERRDNNRVHSDPGLIHQVFAPEQVPDAVTRAVRANRRIAVRSGGHCHDALVDTPDVRTIIDVSQMNSVYYDPAHRAFAVESGATLSDVYEAMYLRWGVAIPGGTCPTVGMGGYVPGGGFGAMCRQHGMCADHLYGVEVAVVDRGRTARLVLGTRDATSPHRDLWWAHTGAGGGNFGVVTRYLFRSPQASGSDPSTLLPRPPASVLNTTVRWSWNGMTEEAFARLMANHGAWHTANSAPDSPYARMFSSLILEQVTAGQIVLVIEMDATVPNAADLVTSYIRALNEGVSVSHNVRQEHQPWLDVALTGLFGSTTGPLDRYKGKGAFLRKPFSRAQVATLYTYLSNKDFPGLTAVALFSYGGKVNTVGPSETASAHRDSILLTYLAGYWSDPDQDEDHVNRIRRIYGELFSATGGVPAPGPETDGTYINYPDVDLADPQQNTSGIPWSTLYFGDNYPRLQRIKQRYDPGNMFHHALSIRLPDAAPPP